MQSLLKDHLPKTLLLWLLVPGLLITRLLRFTISFEVRRSTREQRAGFSLARRRGACYIA